MRVRARVSIAVAVTVGVVLAGAPAAVSAGPAWRSVPHPPTDATLNDVAVIAGNDAWSVGERRPPFDTGYPLAEHWDGTAWRPVAVPDTPTGAGTLDGVAAVSANDVWAVGDSSGQGPVIRHWNGAAWSAVAPAAPPPGEHPGVDRLYDVAATGDQGWAVGLYSSSSAPGPRTLVERWDGRAWSREPTPSPGAISNTLRGVAALSPTDVWAVGWYYSGQNNTALVLHWDGRAWTQSAMSPPPGNTELQGVTAVSSREVWAVGAREGRPLVMRWDGSGWRTLPEPPIANAWLQAAAPDRHGGVWVAGFRMTDDGTVSRPLFLRWNGGRWTVGTSQEREGAVQGLAPAGASIWAVGTTSPCSCFVAPPLVEVNGPIPR